MKNQDMVRLIDKNNTTYFQIRKMCSQLSENLKKRVTLKEFITVACEYLISQGNIDNFFDDKFENKSKRR